MLDGIIIAILIIALLVSWIAIICLVGVLKCLNDILINNYSWDMQDEEKKELIANYIGDELRKVLHVSE